MTSVEEYQERVHRAWRSYALEHVVALALAAQGLLAPVLLPKTW